MKYLILVLTLVIIGFSATAQSNQQNFFVRDSEEMLLVLNEEMVGSTDILRIIPPYRVEEINIYPEEKLSSDGNLFQLKNKKRGIIAANTDFVLETKTQMEINQFFGLDTNNDIYVNGYLLDKKYQIISNSIAKIEVIDPESVLLKTPVLNVIIK